MSELTIIANIKAKQDKVSLIKDELQKLIEVTRAEEGCIHYELHQDNETPAHFLFFEKWKSRELWQKHMKSQHLKNYLVASEGAIEQFTLNEMTSVRSK